MLEFTEVTDPIQVISLPPLYLGMIAADHANLIAAERCVDDCAILAHAYAQLGIAAEVRLTELLITDPHTSKSTTHGSRAPRWETDPLDGDLLHGHTVVWLPDHHCLIDPTSSQFPELAGHDLGPVIARPTSEDKGEGPAGPTGRHEQVHARHGRFELAYTLASTAESTALLDHPILHGDGHRRRGLNVASATIRLIGASILQAHVQQIPHPRTAALVAAVADLTDTRTPEGDWRFVLPDPTGNQVEVRLDEVPLAVDLPQARINVPG